MNLQVRKRGGDVEPWSIDKTVNSIAVAGGSPKLADAVGKLAEAWAEKSATNGVISSIQVRDKVVEILAVVDPMISEAFKAYKK